MNTSTTPEKPKFSVDLSGLYEPPAPVSGMPLEIPLADIEEDPNQPRTEFSEASMEEMTESIKEHNVKQPISIRSNPAKEGKWLINFGARRYRGSIRAGKSTIPAFIDEQSDDFVQVIENEIRDDLTPMDLAIFVAKKISEGMRKSEIAQKLSKDKAMITALAALVDLPACIEAVYRSGRSKSPKALYQLRLLYDKEPEKVENWCNSDVEITQKSVDNFGDLIKNPPPETPVFSNQPIPASSNFDNGFEENDNTGGESENAGESNTPAATLIPFHNPDLEKPTPEPKIQDPNKIKKPLLLIEYKGREAMVILNKMPTIGYLWIKYEDGSGEDEVAVGKCKIKQLTNSSL